MHTLAASLDFLPGVEWVPCSLCGAQDAKLLFKAPVRAHHKALFARDEWDVVRCRRCGLVYHNPIPDASSRDRFYTFTPQADCEFARDWFVEGADLQQPAWRRLLGVLKQYHPGPDLLDVGCGAGSFLLAARQAGLCGRGLEVAPYFIEHCRSRLGLEIYDQPLESLQLPEGSLDVVSALDVIEHVPNPARFVVEVRRVLRPGGLFFLTTHDIGSLFARLYGPRWRYIGPIGHLTYFSRATLAALLRQNGFSVLRSGGFHTIERNPLRQAGRYVSELFKLVVLRGLLLYLYRPLAIRLPFLRRWSLPWKGARLDHDKLMMRVGEQVAMDDELVMIARKEMAPGG